MLFEPNATQAQAILRLLFIPEEPAISKFKPDLSKMKRDELVDAGLIAIQKRGRVQYASLTDHGWGWAAENLDKLAPKTLKQFNPEILQAILGAIGQNMAMRNCSLAELVRPEIFIDVSIDDMSGREVSQEDTLSSESLPEAILRLCRQLTETLPGTPVRLVELRRNLIHVDRSTLDSILLKMQADNEIVLSKLERYEIDAEDEAAAIRIAGLPRHAVYLKRS